MIAQANLAFNKKKGTPGCNLQYPPHAETSRWPNSGAILDIIVDPRPESPTLPQHVEVESAPTTTGTLVPERFAHGYQALEDATETSYQVGEFYAPGTEGGLSPTDPRLGLRWPLPISVISPKDAAWTPLDQIGDEVRLRMKG